MSEEPGDPRLSDDEAGALASVLDEIIPPSGDGRLPGAGELGLAGYIEEALRETPGLRPAIVAGLSALDRLARRRNPQGFAALSAPERVDALNEIGPLQPGFLPILILQTYIGYYQNERVIAALGLEPRPPHPQGYEMDPSDFSILDPVRKRRPMYRDV